MICSYCQTDDNQGIRESHGVCPDCYSMALEQILEDLEELEENQ